jgi:predicted nuclease with TOPRIM domain
MNNSDIDQSKQFLELDVVIKRYIRDIQELQQTLREKREQYNDTFTNDAKIHELEEKTKELKTEKKKVVEGMNKLSSTVALKQNLDDVKDRLKNAKEMLSSYLAKYVTETGATTIEDQEGNILNIVPNYKLKKKAE